jgi:hypothetical protein
VVRAILLVLFAVAIYSSAMATRDAVLSIEIRDGSGKPTPVRVRLLDASGAPPKTAGARAGSETALGIPEAAISVLYGRNDFAEGFQLQPEGSFYVDGAFHLTVPPGKYTIELSKGHEYTRQTATLDAAPGKKLARTFRMERWIDMPARGWYSADDHIHLRRSERENPLILRWMAAEDVHVGNILQMGDFWTHVYSQYAFGKKGPHLRVLCGGEEGVRPPAARARGVVSAIRRPAPARRRAPAVCPATSSSPSSFPCCLVGPWTSSFPFRGHGGR